MGDAVDVPLSQLREEALADHLAVVLNMGGNGTDAHSTEIAAVALAAVLPGETEPISVLLDELAAHRGLLAWIESVGYLPPSALTQWEFHDGRSVHVSLADVDPEAAALLDRLAGES